MRKKLITIFLAAIFAAGTLAGCGNLVTTNNLKYAFQVVAEINPITYSYIDGDGKEVVYESDKVKIYKRDLINVVNQNYSSYMQQNSDASTEKLVEDMLSQLVERELILLETDNLIKQGKIILKDGAPDGEGGNHPFNDLNAVKKEIFNYIDTSIFPIMNRFRAKEDEYIIEQPTYSEAATPDYSTQPSYFEAEEERDELNEWFPSSTVSFDTDPFMLSALKQFALDISKSALEDLSLTAQQKADFEAEQAELKTLCNTFVRESDDMASGQLFQKIYLKLGNGKIMAHLVGKGSWSNIKINRLVEYIIDISEIMPENIDRAFTTALRNQKLQFANISSFESAVSGSDPILYYPNSDYTYVRHILIPFSDEQKAVLQNYENSGDRTYAQIAAMREVVAKDIVGYPRKDGFENRSKKMSISEIYNEVSAKVTPLAGLAKDADRAFMDLIFKYNTDPGIFDSYKGYAVAPYVEDATETFVIEFATAARELREQYNKDRKLGTISKPVLTEHGYHILFLADVPEAGQEANLSSYIARNEYTTFRDYYKKQLQSAAENYAFDNWSSAAIKVYTAEGSSTVNKITNAYKDLYANT